MRAPGLRARTRSPTVTPSRSAVCIGTEMATTRAAAARSGSKGSTDTSRTAGAKPRASRAAAGHATASG